MIKFFFFYFKDKGFFLRENSKQLIVDVIEQLNLVLVFSLFNNVHSIYRISENLLEVVYFGFCLKKYFKIKNFEGFRSCK